MANIIKQLAGPDAVFHKTADNGKFRESVLIGESVVELARGFTEIVHLEDYASIPYATPARVENLTISGSGFSWSLNRMYNWFGASTEAYYFHTDLPYALAPKIEAEVLYSFKYRYVNFGIVTNYVDSDNYTLVYMFNATYYELHVYSKIDGVSESASYVGADLFDTLSKIKFEVSGDNIKAKVWDSSGAEPGSWQIDFTRTDGKTVSAGRIGGYCGGLYGHPKDRGYINSIKVDGLVGFPSDSPVKYMRFDSGKAGTSWSEEVVKLFTNLNSDDAGTCKFKFAYSDSEWGVSEADDGTIDAALSGSWLTPDGSNEVTAPAGSGRYCYIAVQFNSDGEQQTSCLMAVDDAMSLTLPVSGFKPRLQHNNILGRYRETCLR